MSQLRQESLAAADKAWFSVWREATDIIYTAIPENPRRVKSTRPI